MAVGSLKRSSLTAYAKYDSMLAGNAFTPTTFDYEHLGTVTLTSSQASVEFTLNGYATDYKHLQIRAITRSTVSAVADDLYLRINSDATSGNYHYHSLYGTGSVAGSEYNGTLTAARFAQTAGSTDSANYFFPAILDILDPFSSTKKKTLRTLTGSSASHLRIWLTSVLWNSTAPITTLTFYGASGAALATGSRFSIYGVKGSNA